jgi:predicted lipoprotein
VRIFRFGPLVGKGLTPYAYYFDSRLLKGKDFSKAIQQDIRVSSKHSTTTAHLAQTLADKNFKYQGLPATEILLFGAAYPLSAYQKNKTLAGYLHAHALVLKQRAQFIHESWQDDVYVNKLLTETDNTQGKLFNALWDSMGFAHKERLSALYAQEQVFPHRAEAWRSEHSKQNLLAWAQALHAVFSAEQGFYALLKASGYKTGDVFLQQLGVMQTALHELPGSLSASLKHDWRSVDKIATALNLVMGTFERDVVNTLGVNLGFNFNDGD